MMVYGLDFSSNPDGQRKSMPLAECGLVDKRLTINCITLWPSNGRGSFEEFELWLSEPGKWIAGIDFPFGQPAAAIEHFGWLDGMENGSWRDYIDVIQKSTAGRMERFQQTFDGWTKSSGKRVHLLRLADRVAGFSGHSPSSPMKVAARCNPPIERMFFEGSRRLRQADVSIPAVGVVKSEKTVLEAYPAMVAHALLPNKKYKDADETWHVRKELIAKLKDRSVYGFEVVFAHEKDRDSCIADEKGDRLDSVLCAMQAAWASSQPNWGVPRFGMKAIRDIVALEGWICDPAMQDWFRKDSVRC